MLCNTEDPFTLFPFSILLSLSILPFDFSSSWLLSLTLQRKRIQTLTRWLLWDTSLPSWSASFRNKPLSLPQLCLWDSWACRAVNRVSLDSVTKLPLPFSQSGMALGFCFFCICFINLLLCETSFFFLLKVTLLSLFLFPVSCGADLFLCWFRFTLYGFLLKYPSESITWLFSLIREFGCLWIDFHRF